MDSEDCDNLYYDEDDVYCSNDDVEDDAIIRTQQTYKVLEEADINQRVKESTAYVSCTLSLSKPVASILLCHYRWNPKDVVDAWFSNEQGTRKSVGLISRKEKRKNIDSETLTCGICFDEITSMSVPAEAPLCGHTFCPICWQSYISVSIEGGPGCLFLRCPEPSCREAVGADMVEKLVVKKKFEKYSRYILHSYVEGDPRTKWCPGPGCEYIVEFNGDDVGCGNYDVSCRCSYNFCWKCSEEPHRPVDCSTISKWISKTFAESANVTWIAAFTKPCPLCKSPIERRSGCNHMTCQACGFDFCWLCLQRDSASHKCHDYEANYEDVKKQILARNYIQKYAHYFERWAVNDKSEKKALADLRDLEGVKIERLSHNVKQPVTRLSFVTEGWSQIVECRRILKWTYAFGYHLEENCAKKRFLEYLQGEAEVALERLHKCAENDLKGFMDSKGKSSSETFDEFRTKLTGLTSVTKNYFENLVKALENGLSDVEKDRKIQIKGHKQSKGHHHKGLLSFLCCKGP